MRKLVVRGREYETFASSFKHTTMEGFGLWNWVSTGGGGERRTGTHSTKQDKKRRVELWDVILNMGKV